ncbi:hypothetical protein AB0F30_36465 [Streptomyces sp. NPDC029006]
MNRHRPDDNPKTSVTQDTHALDMLTSTTLRLLDTQTTGEATTNG